MVKKKSFFEKVEAEVVSGAQNYVETKVKKKLVKIGEISLLVLLGFILISFGLAQVIGFYFPMVANGFNYIILGIIFFIIGAFLGM